MMETLRNYIETMFSALPQTPEAARLKAEMTANMEERFEDLLREGKSEAEAVGTILAGFGTVEELRAVLESGERERGDYVRRSGKGFDFHEAGGDHVHIGLDGIHVHEAHGDHVDVSFSGVRVEKAKPEEDGVEEVYVDRHGVYVKKRDEGWEWRDHKRAPRWLRVVSGILPPLSVLIYLLMGAFFGMWHPWWLLIVGAALLTGSLNGLLGAKEGHAPGKAALRRAEGFFWPLVVFAFLVLGVCFDLWHPGWAIFPICGVLDGIVNTIVNAGRGEDEEGRAPAGGEG